MDHYIVSYIVYPAQDAGRAYRQHRVFNTNDLETIVISIIPTRRRTGRGKLKAQLKEYAEHRRVSFGRPGNTGIIRDIVIKRLPEEDKKILDKYHL